MGGYKKYTNAEKLNNLESSDFVRTTGSISETITGNKKATGQFHADFIELSTTSLSPPSIEYQWNLNNVKGKISDINPLATMNNPTNIKQGSVYTLSIYSSDSSVITWGSVFKGDFPTIGANKINYLTFESFNGVNLYLTNSITYDN